MAEDYQDDHGEAPNKDEQNSAAHATRMAQQIAEAQRDWAYRMWQFAGEQHGLAFDLWLAAQDYVKCATYALMDSAERASPSNKELARIRDALSDSQYFDRTRDLAYRMWVESGPLPGTTLAHFWRDATRHLSAVVIGATNASKSAADVADALWQVSVSFSPTAHLKEIQEMAYLHWIGRGKPFWEAMEDWVEAENEALRLKAEGFTTGWSWEKGGPRLTEAEK